MSQLCKYHLRGSCKYGHRCHFLHEYSYDHSYDHNRLSSHQKYSKNIEYSHSYNKDYVQNYGKDYSYYVNPRSNSGDSHVPKQNYSRYRIDYHQNQRELRNVESISPADFLEIVNLELVQHERSHMWPFTVIAPVKDFGNIPGFRDYSPEEVRYQYYESLLKNTVFDFEKSMTDAQNELIRSRQMFKNKSIEAINNLKTMMQERKIHKSNVATNFTPSTASDFSFNVEKLQQNQSLMNIEMNFPNTSTNPSLLNISPSSPKTDYFSANSQSISGKGVNQNMILENSTNDFNVNNAFNQFQSQSVIDTFSFNLKYIDPNHENGKIQPVDICTFPRTVSRVDDSVYSNLEKLPTETQGLFLAKTFKCGKIPLVPPPRQFCFH